MSVTRDIERIIEDNADRFRNDITSDIYVFTDQEFTQVLSISAGEIADKIDEMKDEWENENE